VNGQPYEPDAFKFDMALWEYQWQSASDAVALICGVETGGTVTRTHITDPDAPRIGNTPSIGNVALSVGSESGGLRYTKKVFYDQSTFAIVQDYPITNNQDSANGDGAAQGATLSNLTTSVAGGDDGFLDSGDLGDTTDMWGFAWYRNGTLPRSGSQLWDPSVGATTTTNAAAHISAPFVFLLGFCVAMSAFVTQ